MSINDKLQLLTQKICDKTIAGQLTWERTSNPQAFLATLNTYVIRISQEAQMASYPFVALSLYDSDNILVEKVSSLQLPSLLQKQLENAYTAARRQALDVEQRIDKLLGVLDDPHPEELSLGEVSDQPALKWEVEGKAIVLVGGFSYVITLDRCDTLEKILDWVLHLSEKTWVTTDLIESFIHLAIDANNIPFNQGVA